MSAPKSSATKRHPVADNPLRLLHGQGWTTLADLRRNARTFQLLARRSAVPHREPRHELCLRQRTYEDYLWAEKAISTGESLTVALIFTLIDWEHPAEIVERANLALLEAEALPQGHEKKATLLVEALRVFERDDLDAWIDTAARWSEEQLSTHVDRGAVKLRIHADFKGILERAIGDFGDTVDDSELDLLDAIDAAKNIPEIGGFARAIEEAFGRQFQQLVDFRDRLEGAIDSLRAAPNHMPRAELDGLLAHAESARRVLRQIQQRPLLRTRLNPAGVHAVANRMAHVAWILGVQHSEWPTAARFVENVQENAIQHEDEYSQQCLRAVVRLAPVITGTFPPQRDREIRALVARYPLAADTLRRFLSPPRPAEAAKAVASPSGTAQTPKKQSSGCLAVIVLSCAVVFLVWLFNQNARPSRTPSYTAPQTNYSPQSTKPDDSVQMTGRDGMKYWVSHANYLRLKPIYDELTRRENDLDQRVAMRRRAGEEIDAARLTLDRTSQSAVALFNANVERHNAQNDSLQRALDAFNRDVQAYNADLERVGRRTR